MELKEKENIDLESIVDAIVENPMDSSLYKHIDELKDEISNKLGIKKREKMQKRFSETLVAVENISKEHEEEDLDELEKALEGEEVDENAREEIKVISRNNDIASLFFKKHMEFAGKRGSIVKEYKRIRKDKRIKRILKKIANSKFYSLMLLLNKADPLEVEAILSKLLPSLIQAGVSEKSIKVIVEILGESLDKGRMKGSREFFEKLNRITSFINKFGGSEELIGLLREME